MRVLNSITVAVSLLLPIVVHADSTPEVIGVEQAAPAAAKPAKAPAAKNNSPIKVTKEEQPNSMMFYASDKAAELIYERSGSVFNLNNARATAGFLITEERDNVLSGSVMYDVEREFLKGLSISFGPTVYAGLLGLENADVIAFAAGIDLGYQLPIRQIPLQFRLTFNYAPDILTFGQSDRVIDWTLRSGLALTENIDGFIGLRFLQFDTRPGDRNLDQQAHIGVRWKLKN